MALTTDCSAPPPSCAAIPDFGPLLHAHRVRRCLTYRQLAQEAGCDSGHLVRLEHELRPPPSRALVDALADGLGLYGLRYRQFLTAAGYAPVAEWTPELEAAYRKAADEGRTP